MAPCKDLRYLAFQKNAYYKRVSEWRRNPNRTDETFPVEPPVVHPEPCVEHP
jgi:hypothetical protein